MPTLRNAHLIGDGERTLLVSVARTGILFHVIDAAGTTPIGTLDQTVDTLVAGFDGRDAVLAWNVGQQRLLAARVTLAGAVIDDNPLVLVDGLTNLPSVCSFGLAGRDGQALVTWWRSEQTGQSLRATRLADGERLDAPELVLRADVPNNHWTSQVVAVTGGYWIADGTHGDGAANLSIVGRDGSLEAVALDAPSVDSCATGSVELEDGRVLLLWARPGQIRATVHDQGGAPLTPPTRLATVDLDMPRSSTWLPATGWRW